MAIRYRGKRAGSRNADIVAALREAAGASAPVDPHMAIKRKAAEISTMMALLHGGDWSVLVDHQARLVIVAPSIPPVGEGTILR